MCVFSDFFLISDNYPHCLCRDAPRPTTIMNIHSHFLKKAAAITCGIPLLERKLQGWKTLSESYVQSAPGEHPEVEKILREALPVAGEALLLSRCVAAIVPYADTHTLAAMIRYASARCHQLEHLAHATREAIKAETAPTPSHGLPQELADSDVVRYWKKRAQTLLSSISITIYRKESK